jgi:arylsulfatase A-like enzyme
MATIMTNRFRGKTNVLFITADQWRGDSLSLLGHPSVRTPNIDALAADGICFTNHYSQATPCGPARASLYTGLYLMNHRVCVNGSPLDARHTNVALEARRAGYEPTLFGYTDQSVDPRTVPPGDARLLTYEGVLPGFHQRLAMDTPPALDWMSWLKRQGVDTPATMVALYRTQPAAKGRLNVADHLTQRKFGAEHTESRFVTDSLLEFLSLRSGTGWFAHVSYIRPHPPFSVPEPYASMIAPSDTPKPIRRASLAEERRQHPFLDLALRKSTKEKAVAGQGDASSADWTIEEVAEIRAIYHGMQAEVDAEIGRVIDHLKQSGDYENTLIIMTSDHGEMLGDHYLFGKFSYFDAAFHIPLIVRAPGAGMTRGGRVDAFSEAIDVMPTILDALGLEVPSQVDGRSLEPFLRGEVPPNWRDGVHWELDFRDVLMGQPERDFGLTLDQCQLSVVRDERYKYVHFPGLPALFLDLERDPGEFDNRAEDPDYRDLVLEYAQKMLSWRMTHADRTLSGMSVGATGLVTRTHAERWIPRS